jgi:hypothetical protein
MTVWARESVRCARWSIDGRLDGVEPVSGEVGDLLAQAGGGGDVLIYVHGFNQTFETAALDAARLSDAIKFRGRTMAFSWPSRAELLNYVNPLPIIPTSGAS